MTDTNDQPASASVSLGNEADMLLGFLDRQRATFAWKTAGLDAADLRATLAPSPLTLGGMLKHLARFEDDMSTEWLHGQPQLAPWNAIDWDADREWDWRSAADDAPQELYARWQQAVERSRAMFRAALASGGPDLPGTGNRADLARLPSVRYILVNMIEEYARHNGHADLIRESIDGLVGHDPPE